MKAFISSQAYFFLSFCNLTFLKICQVLTAVCFFMGFRKTRSYLFKVKKNAPLCTNKTVPVFVQIL